MPSLRRRLILSVSVSLVLFFGVTIVALDAVFRGLVDRSLDELLDAQTVALIAATEAAPDAITVTRLADPRLATPGSGLYAAIDGGGESWRSPSSIGARVAFGAPLAPGARRTVKTRAAGIGELVVRSRGIAWRLDDGRSLALTFSVATDLDPYVQQLARVRSQMFGWFVSLAVLLLGTLAVLLRRTLAPVQRLEDEIRGIESGAREALSTRWPRELSGVAANLNALLAAERERITRYRKTLGNLAHSLKTPLAVMRASLPGATSVEALRGPLEREIDRMGRIVEHQLRRAATSGGATVGQGAVEVRPVVADLRAALLRAHGAKDFAIENALPGELRFVGDRDDLAELLGNVMDNACKWCATRVRITGRFDPGAPPRARLRIVVEDDGPGISDEDRERVLERGARADEATPGHGLGLAMVRDAVALYGGTLTIGPSPALGGAGIELALPGR
ncbi:MAG: Adaptive-response sensory-kinase SasA [Steroidobacteraceae bacterium]|nr:Adaptive-response sensory-kinase SasA [Steroidobacteraceae bacterium]